jgi:iron complex outermembrane recepter protein
MKLAFLCGASAAAVTIAALGASQAMAQTANPPAAAGSENVGANVTVVAQKRTESIEKVPVAVTAFTSQQRSLLGIRTINDMAEFTPGLSYFNGDDRTFIRGIGRQTDLLSVSPGVAIYKDGVYAGGNGSIALQQDTLFVDRIEVDRGPQSTLYGRNSDGGAVNYIFRRPTDSWQEEVRAGVGAYDKYYGEGLVSGPLNDHVRVLFGGNYFQENGGYWKDLIGHPEGGDISQGGNGASHYLVGEFDATYGPLDWWGKASTGDYVASWYQGPVLGVIGDSEFPAGVASPEPSAFYGLCALPGNTGVGCNAFSGVGHLDAVVPGSPVALGRVTSITNVNDANNRNFIGGVPNTTSVKNDLALSTTLTWHAPGADVKYIGGYESFLYVGRFTNQSGSTSGLSSYQLAGPAPNSPAALACEATFKLTAGLCTQPLTINAAPNWVLFIENEQFFSHELSISSTYQGPVQYIAGLYWFHDHYDQPIDLDIGDQPQFLNPFGGPPNNTGVDAPILTDRAGTLNDYAAYGQVDWKVTDTVKITGGLRYTEDQTSGFIAERFMWFDNPDISGFIASNDGANTPAIDVTKGFAIASGGCGNFVGLPLSKGAGPCVVRPDGFIQQNLNATFSAVTGTAGIEWTPDSHTLAYLKYSRGYKNGAFDTPQIVSTPETAAEFVDDYEAGVKLSQRTWTVNADVFYYNYTNDQQPLTVQSPLPGGGFANVGELFNIPVVHTYGIELEGTWRPIEPLVLNAQYSYLSAKIASTGGKCLLDTSDPLAQSPGANTSGCAQPTPATAVVQNVVGQYLPQAPANKFSVDGIYTFRFDPGNLALSASVTWRDKSYGTIFNRPYDTIPAFYLLNLRATWTDAQNRYTVTGFVDNVFNQIWSDNVVGALLDSGGPTSINGREIIDKAYTYGAPITAGLEVQVRWR